MAQKIERQKAKAKILVRIQRIETGGNFGNCQPVGAGISELRIHYAAGYRVYLKQNGDQLVVLLAGGDKATQQTDIDKAKQLWIKYKKQRKI